VENSNVIIIEEIVRARDVVRDDRVSALGVLQEARRILSAYDEIPEVNSVLDAIEKSSSALYDCCGG
jgi:hypothetical protein